MLFTLSFIAVADEIVRVLAGGGSLTARYVFVCHYFLQISRKDLKLYYRLKYVSH